MEWKLDWGGRYIKILRIECSINLAEMVEKNYKKVMKHWSTRNLTVIGRHTLLRSFLLPKLNHIFSILPNPSAEFLQELQKECYSFT